MATLVLSSVGSAVGGPIGSVIGSAVGGMVDRRLFGRASGRRLSDLRVQTSSYGSQIPGIIGTMRVAGTVIWATDLQPGNGGGGKGGPTSPTYTVSLAVALSSRPLKSVQRIWADNRLIRGKAGDLKLPFKLRLCPGGEDQAVHPLIASAEGIGKTPAYRGCALAILEDLPLASFGNRVPLLTFEVEGATGPLDAGALVKEVSRGFVGGSPLDWSVSGYAVQGDSLQDALEPIVDALGLRFVSGPGGLHMQEGGRSEVIRHEQVGCTTGLSNDPADGETVALDPRQAGRLSLTYFDPELDYAAGEKAAHFARDLPTERIDFPGTLTSSLAKVLAHQALAERWSARERVTIRLPISFLHLRPGDLLQLPDRAEAWFVEAVSLEDMIVEVVLARRAAAVSAAPADPGRAAKEKDVPAQPTLVRLLDLPSEGLATAPEVWLAAAAGAEPWQPVPVELSWGAERLSTASARVRAVMGRLTQALPAGDPCLFDDRNVVTVQLAPDDWLSNVTDADLLAGGNLAAIGRELVQFGRAKPIGGGQFELRHLLRGRQGTEWASQHGAGESFTMLDPASIVRVPLPFSALGQQLSAMPSGLADTGQRTQLDFAGESLRPPSPAALTAVRRADGLHLRWIRRSRLGWHWLDGVDAGLGESVERYRVRLTAGSNTVEWQSDSSEFLITSEQVASVGPGDFRIEVAQIGDHAISHPAQLTLTQE